MYYILYLFVCSYLYSSAPVKCIAFNDFLLHMSSGVHYWLIHLSWAVLPGGVIVAHSSDSTLTCEWTLYGRSRSPPCDSFCYIVRQDTAVCVGARNSCYCMGSVEALGLLSPLSVLKSKSVPEKSKNNYFHLCALFHIY